MKGTLRKTCAARFGLRRAATERSRTIHHPTLTETERRQTWPSKVLQSKSSRTFLQIHPRHPGASWLPLPSYRARSHQTFTRDGGSMTIRPHNCITNNCSRVGGNCVRCLCNFAHVLRRHCDGNKGR